MPFLDHIGGQLGLVDEEKRARNNQVTTIPSMRILMHTITHFPKAVYLPTSGGGKSAQKVEFVGLPNQCIYCKQIGHFVNECEHRKSKVISSKRDQNSQSMYPNVQQKDSFEENFKGSEIDLTIKNNGNEWRSVVTSNKVVSLANATKDKGTECVWLCSRYDALQGDVNMLERIMDCKRTAPSKFTDHDQVIHKHRALHNEGILVVNKLVEGTNVLFRGSKREEGHVYVGKPLKTFNLHDLRLLKGLFLIQIIRSIENQGKDRSNLDNYGYSSTIKMNILNYKNSKMKVGADNCYYKKPVFHFGFTTHFGI